MALFEISIALLISGAVVAAWARRLGAPYPAFLAIAGAVLGLVPGTPTLSLQPELVMTLFVAPTLLDAAYDASPRDMRDNWLPIASGAIGAVALTVAAVAWIARVLRPDMPWPAAIALGAIVAPPDASAATAVLRALRPPHRVLVILEGESLLNDATALLIYRAALMAVVGAWAGWGTVPALLGSLLGSVVLGCLAGALFPVLMSHIDDVPTSIVTQFAMTFGLWILADRLGLSPVITLVCNAVVLARTAPMRSDALHRIPSYAVWEVAVFVLNVLAFILIGLQLRPILAGLHHTIGASEFGFAGAVLGTTLLVRVLSMMSLNTAVRWKQRHFGVRLRRPMMLPTIGSGLLIAWCGMRGIVTLATALALPEKFPFRDLILLAAFGVVLGTLVIQGLTLRPLMLALRLTDDGTVDGEVRLARAHSARAALEVLADETGQVDGIRRYYEAWLRGAGPEQASVADVLLVDARRRVLAAERHAIYALRSRGEIGDDAFHVIEQELDATELYIENRLARGG